MHGCRVYGGYREEADEQIQGLYYAPADLRTLLETSGVFVSYSVLREGTRMMGGQSVDPGYAKLRRLIEDAKTAGVDWVNHATYQTVLGTAPSLAIVLDPQAREAEEVVDYVSDMNNSPNRDLLVSALSPTTP